MFATVLGALPLVSPSSPDDDSIRRLVSAQDSAGLDPVTDAGARWRPSSQLPTADDAVKAWRFAAGCTSRAAKAVLPGPFSLARSTSAASPRPESPLALTEQVRAVVDSLAEAGCPIVEIDEPAAVEIGADRDARDRFREAHIRLADGAPVHLSLALSGGNVGVAGARIFLDPPYASYAVDVVAGPDNWRLVAEIPGDRGVVIGALRPDARAADGPELLVWAVHYAASTSGRGLDRVGLANAPGLEALPWAVAVRKLERLGEAARIAGLPRTGELAAALDARAGNLRSRTLGRDVGRRR